MTDWLDKIPKDIDECFEAIQAIVNPEELKEFQQKSEEDSSWHFGFGRWMRNNWGLWGDSELRRYFNAMGIHHGDDMSAIIMTSLHRHLNGRDLELDKQVKFYREYWSKYCPSVNDGKL